MTLRASGFAMIGPQTRMAPSKEPRRDGETRFQDRRASCLTLAFLSALCVFVAQPWDDDHLWKYAADAFTTLGGTALLVWICGREPLSERRLSPHLAAALGGFFVLPVILEVALRQLLAQGDAAEVVMLACLRNAALGTAAFARHRSQARLSCIFSSFLTLFSISISDGRVVYVPASIFSLVGLWSLMGAYWDRWQAKSAIESRPHLPLKIGLLGAVCTVLAAAGALLAGARHELIALPGFMPTSGGQHGSDPYARQGIGDGDMLAAAKQQAMTFGPVDSEQFLESQMPSLYDMLDDRYGEPTIKPRKVQRAVALSGKDAVSRLENASSSKRSGREFAAARRKAGKRSLMLKGTESDALLYVLGPVPVHLALETYDSFDGATWIHDAAPTPQTPLEMNTTGDRPWLEFRSSPAEWVLARERHAVKIINLKSARFPSPPLLTAASIDRVNRADLFGWANNGVLEIEGQESIPQFTVVQLVNNVLGVGPVRMHACSESGRATQRPFCKVPEVASLEEARHIASLWTRGLPPGWRHVESIVEHLRSDFARDDDATAPPGCTDVVGHFLKQRHGPDYLFATTAAVLLRLHGYPTRLVAGFYANARRYDHRAGQTAVVKDDTHVWLEVAAGQGTWIPVEPTPGYEPPRMVLTWSEYAWSLALGFSTWAAAKWPFVSALFALALLAAWKRQQVIDSMAWLAWRAALLGKPRWTVLATMRLLECRARLAGCSRPPHRTVSAWHGSWLPTPPSPASDAVRQVTSLFNWVLYAPRTDEEVPLSAIEVKQICRAAVRAASLRTMRGMQPLTTPSKARRR
jgi:protein-glutamine gamma-glutamyltransferase